MFTLRKANLIQLFNHTFNKIFSRSHLVELKALLDALKVSVSTATTTPSHEGDKFAILFN